MAFDFSRSRIGMMPPGMDSFGGTMADVTAGISPDMRAEMNAKENRNRQVALALLQNPLFAGDPAALTNIMGSAEAGATPSYGGLTTPGVLDTLRRRDYAQGVQQRGVEAGVQGQEFAANALTGRRELSPTQMALLHAAKPSAAEEAIQRSMSGDVTPGTEGFLAGQVWPSMTAGREKTEAETKNLVENAGVLKNPLFQALFRIVSAQGAAGGLRAQKQFEVAKNDLTDLINKYIENKSLVPSNNTDELGRRAKVFQDQLKHLIVQHQEAWGTSEGKQYLARIFALLGLGDQQGGAGASNPAAGAFQFPGGGAFAP